MQSEGIWVLTFNVKFSILDSTELIKLIQFHLILFFKMSNLWLDGVCENYIFQYYYELHCNNVGCKPCHKYIFQYYYELRCNNVGCKPCHNYIFSILL